MFIKKLFCNYNAQELLLVASRLAFALCTGRINTYSGIHCGIASS